MTVTVDIQELKKNYLATERELQNVERDIEQAERDKGGLAEELTTLGFDVTGDLRQQLDKKGGELSGLIEQADDLVTNAVANKDESVGTSDGSDEG